MVENPPVSEETRVQSLVQEDPTCLGATRPVHRSYRSPTLEAVLCRERSPYNERLTLQPERVLEKQQRPSTVKSNQYNQKRKRQGGGNRTHTE